VEEGGPLTVWRVITDSEERTLLQKDEVYQIPFATLTPYIIPHRFYGESVADKLIEVQKIKTALLRMLLDSGYFALNQRNYVNMRAVNEFTISDLLNNEPGRPVRGEGPASEAVSPISAGALNFDVFSAMEYVNTMAEGRSGIVRNAQGLNPDTLHETAKGAMALIAAAQKRVRMIARIFAETGIKDLFVGVHCELRNGFRQEGKSFQPIEAKVGRQWKSASPGEWPDRCAMTVHVGVGSAGREHELAVAGQRLELMQSAVELQGGLEGPIVDGKNLHAALMDWERAGGSKRGDKFWSDPADPNAPKPQPKPDPEMMKAQAELQLKQQSAAADVQLAQTKAQTDAQLTAQKHQNDLQASAAKAEQDHQLALARLDAEMQLKREQIAAELQLKREQLSAELELKRELGYAQAAASHEVGMAKVNASTSQVEPGGEPG
jgi:hypothetical protein